jgi:predicted phosphate transport protein (TIGR00153 family)
MRFNTLFSRLTPHERKFYPLLNGMANYIVQASAILIEIANAERSQFKDLYLQIKSLETKCDRILGRLFDELNNTFITPFDREDINALGEELDNLMDTITSAAKRTEMYQPCGLPPRALELALLLQDSCTHVQNAVNQLDTMQKSSKKIKDICQQLHDIENQADDVYEHFVIDIFESETNAINLIKLKEILQEIERATDRADSVGKIIKAIIVKYT